MIFTINTTGISVNAPGMTGTVVPIGPSETRAGIEASSVFDAAIAQDSAQSAVIQTLFIDLIGVPAESSGPGVGDSRGSAGEGPIEIKIQARSDDTNYAVLYTDLDTNLKTWRYQKRRELDGTSQHVVVAVPDVVVEMEDPTSTSDTRGPVTKAMRFVAKVVAWIAKPIVDSAAKKIAGDWEASRRPYGLFAVSADGKLDKPDWTAFKGGAALLLVHGTFSTPQAFGGWTTSKDFPDVWKHYGGRCLAFAHPTLSQTPDENSTWLKASLPKDLDMELDLVSHSRGGLVVRAFAAAVQGSNKNVRKMVLVASPNYGTPMAEGKRVATFIDTYTNLLTDLPDGVATILAEGIICLVKILGGNAMDGLPGLLAMNTTDGYLKELAGRSWKQTPRVYAVSSNYSAKEANAIKQLLARAEDSVLNAFFREPNDMVVPTLGCSQGPFAAAGFPIAADQLMALSGNTNHCCYFDNQSVREKLGEWLA